MKMENETFKFKIYVVEGYQRRNGRIKEPKRWNFYAFESCITENHITAISLPLISFVSNLSVVFCVYFSSKPPIVSHEKNKLSTLLESPLWAHKNLQWKNIKKNKKEGFSSGETWSTFVLLSLTNYCHESGEKGLQISSIMSRKAESQRSWMLGINESESWINSNSHVIHTNHMWAWILERENLVNFSKRKCHKF